MVLTMVSMKYVVNVANVFKVVAPMSLEVDVPDVTIHMRTPLLPFFVILVDHTAAT